MNGNRAPQIDERSAEVVATYVRERLEIGAQDELGGGLTQVFARYCALLLDRLNAMPELHHRAFLELLRIEPQTAAAACAPLTVVPAQRSGGRTRRVLVPARTQFAAGTGKDAVVFESTADFEPLDVAIRSVMLVDCTRGRWADALALLDGSGPILRATVVDPVPRALHVALQPGMAAMMPGELALDVIVGERQAPQAAASYQWGAQSGTEFFPLMLLEDGTYGLSGSGRVRLRCDAPLPVHWFAGREAAWLTCRAVRTASLGPNDGHAGAEGDFLLGVVRVRIAASHVVRDAPVEAASCGPFGLDVSRPFYPLGERPRFGDVFHLRSEWFARPGATVALAVEMVNPSGAANAPVPVVGTAGRPRLIWEYWRQGGWVALDARDGTGALTASGVVRAAIPADAATTSVNGQPGGWLRARLSGGHYGVETTDTGAPAQVAAPMIASLKMSCARETSPVPADACLAERDFEWCELSARAIDEVTAPPAANHYLLLGLAEGTARALPGRPLSFYVGIADRHDGESHGGTAATRGMPRWQYRGANGWRDCRIEDGTDGFRHSGIVTVRAGRDAITWSASTLDPTLQWLRILWRAEDERPFPLVHITPNTLTVVQQTTVENELLGSGNGQPHQVFQLLRPPLVGTIDVEVRDADATPGAAVWEAWTRVADFTLSSAMSRHYVVAANSGQVRFGDGERGRVPPRGPNNVRARRYATGGGRHGNCGAGAINSIRAAVPYVDSVFNPAAAQGGTDAEDWANYRAFAGAWIRHRDRAVGVDDYEDLAQRASAEVARALCVPTRDLGRDPAASETTAGVVSIVVVPDTLEPCPRPSFELLGRVEAYLTARAPVGVRVVAMGPAYVRVELEVEVVARAGAAHAQLEEQCVAALHAFLHPLHGGSGGNGWRFGTAPRPSDYYPLLERIADVDHVRSLRQHLHEGVPGSRGGSVWLIGVGNIEVRIWP